MRAACLVGTVLLVSTTCLAQEPFSRVSVRAGGSYNAGRGVLHEYWEPGYGAELAFSTPFYLGDAEVGFALHRYEAADRSVPRFDAFLAHVGWGIGLSPVEFLSWYNGFRIGNCRMSFDEDTFPGVRNESEVMLGVQSRIDIHLSKTVNIYAAARYTQTYTFIRIRAAYVAAGLTATVDSPRWLRTFLR